MFIGIVVKMVSRVGSRCSTGTAGSVRILQLWKLLYLADVSDLDIILAACDVEGNFLVVKVSNWAFVRPGS